MPVPPNATLATASCLLAACLALAACKPQQEAAPAQAPQPTSPADMAAGAPGAQDPPASTSAPTHPVLRVSTLEHGEYDLAEQRGKWVVVNFWATWCAPCLKEMPELSALDAMNEHIEVVGLAYEEIDPEAMRAFLAAHPVTYPVAIVDVYDPPADFETPRGLPMTYLLDPEGKVAETFMGPVTAADIERVIAAAGA